MLIECNELSENVPGASLRGNNGFVGLKNQLEDITMHFVGITLGGRVGWPPTAKIHLFSADANL